MNLHCQRSTSNSVFRYTSYAPMCSQSDVCVCAAWIAFIARIAHLIKFHLIAILARIHYMYYHRLTLLMKQTKPNTEKCSKMNINWVSHRKWSKVKWSRWYESMNENTSRIFDFNRIDAINYMVHPSFIAVLKHYVWRYGESIRKKIKFWKGYKDTEIAKVTTNVIYEMWKFV